MVANCATPEQRAQLEALGFLTGSMIQFWRGPTDHKARTDAQWVDRHNGGWYAGMGVRYETPLFDDPWTAYVYATADNWGQ